jgi:predicted nucleotidyltransferase
MAIMHDTEFYRLSKKERLSLMALKFTDVVKGAEGIEKVILFGSVVTDKLNPRDLDLAVYISDYKCIPQIALAARRLTPIYHGWEVFVMGGKTGRYIGRICKRKPSNCPTNSVECNIPDCGKIPLIKVIEGFEFNEDEFLSSPNKVLWERTEAHAI